MAFETQKILHILKQLATPDNPLIDSIQLFMDANNDLVAQIHDEKDPGTVELFQLVDFDGYVTIPVGNQAIDLLSGHFFKSTPDQDATWTTTSARQGWLVWLHVDNAGGHTISFGSGFTDVSSITDTGIVTKLLYYDGATWREIETGGGGGGSLPAGVQGDILYHNGSDWVVLNAGDSGEILKTQGAGANPIWDSISNRYPFEAGKGFLFCFKMVDETDFASPETGKSPTVTVSKNGAAFGALTGTPAVSEVGSGWYKVSVPASDMVSGVVVLKATATDCAQEDFVIYMA